MPTRNDPRSVFKYIDMSGGPTSCWPWKRSVKGSGGRPYFSVDGKKRSAYRVVYELTYGVTLTKDIMIRHKCDNPICCNPDHLEIGSHQDNMNDMKSRERHGMPHDRVRLIRRMVALGFTHADIGVKFGVSRETISAIHQRRIYKHVEDEEPTT
jgi:hypothetical protein